jgi:hypothetical protein
MMRDMSALPNRLSHPLGGYGDERNGAAIVKINGVALRVIFSDGMGWDHVSVSLPSRCPTWTEMCAVKDLFFDDCDTVVQFHPAAAEYVNLHSNCLHLWRDQVNGHVLPNIELV